MVFKHFTARDVVSRWDVVEACTRATATTAARFLDTLQQRLPFPLRALQVDGGSEFAAQFEAECQRRSIRLFVLPPRSPKLNGCVERAHRTHTEESFLWKDGWPQSGATGLGTYLQHHPAPPGPGLPYPATVSAPMPARKEDVSPMY
jgi:hypothetical protein